MRVSGAMERSIQWVRDGDELERHLEALGTGPLAVDCEADSLHHYPEKVCLIQLSFSDRDLLLDPLGDLDLSPLDPVLRDRSVRKLLHAGDYDLRVLDRDFGLRVRGLFDTMIAARLTGETAFGLAALLRKHLGIDLDKRFQRADWSQRPLSPEMERYAVMDTRHLSELAEKLTRRLRELGRGDWAEEEFSRLESVRWSRTVDPEPFRRVKGSAGLDRRQLAVLRELHGLRERIARRRDRPPFRILQERCLLEIARRVPRSAAELLAVPGFPRRGRMRNGEAEWLRAIERACELPDPACPERRRRGVRRREARFERRLKALSRARDGIARELGLEPGLIGPRAALEALLDALDQGEGTSPSGPLRRWQLELLGPAIESLAP